MLEDVLVRQQIPYQVIGGPRFYERAEIRDAIAYLIVLNNSADAVSLTRIANRPRRGIGDTTLQRLAGHRQRHLDPALEALADPRGAGVGAIEGGALPPQRDGDTLMTAQELELNQLLEAVLEDPPGRREADKADRRSRRAKPQGIRDPGAASRRTRCRAEREDVYAGRLSAGSELQPEPGHPRQGPAASLMTITMRKARLNRIPSIGMERERRNPTLTLAQIKRQQSRRRRQLQHWDKARRALWPARPLGRCRPARVPHFPHDL